MSLIIVGGHECMDCRYREICKKRGHSVKVYTRMTPQLSKHIGKADGIILFTSTVSHTMVEIAVDVAKRRGIRILRSHNSSAFSLTNLLNDMESVV